MARATSGAPFVLMSTLQFLVHVEWMRWRRLSCLAKPAISSFFFDKCSFTGYVRSLEHSLVLQNVHFRLPDDKPDDDGMLVSGFFRLQEVTRRYLPLVDGDASTREEARDLIFHILKILLRSCVWRFSCIPMCSRTRIRGVSHTQNTDDDVIDKSVLLEVINFKAVSRSLVKLACSSPNSEDAAEDDPLSFLVFVMVFVSKSGRWRH